MTGKEDRTVLERPLDERRLEPPVPHQSPRKKKRCYLWVWLLILGGLIYGGYYVFQATKTKQTEAGRGGKMDKGANRPIPVVAVSARTGDIPIYLRGLGTVTAFNTVSVKSRVDGQLEKIYFQEGQNVRAGDLLATVDPRPFQVQLDQAQGQLARDQAQLKDAQVNLARYQALWEEKVIAKQQYDTQASTVGQNLGTIEADKAAIGNAKLQLTYARILAPISGRIGLRQVDAGNIIHAADPNGLAVIVQLQPIAVLFTIPADNLPVVMKSLRSGQRLTVDAYDRDDKNKIASGFLLTVDNTIDPQTGTSRLKAQFSNTDNALFPNQFVNCRMLVGTRHNAIIVPSPAVQRGPQGTYVYVVKPDKSALPTTVTTGVSEGNDVEIASGIDASATVVVDGQDKLQEGSKVDIRTPNANPAGRRRKA